MHNDPNALDLIPPHNLEAEMAVLGAILVDPDPIMGVAAEIVQAADFYAHTHETIFTVLLTLQKQSIPIDKISVGEALRKRDQLERVGGLSYISRLMDTVQTASSAAYYAKIVREKAVLRGLIHSGGRIAQLGYQGEEDVTLALTTAQQLVGEVAARGIGRSSSGLDMAGALDEWRVSTQTGLATYCSPWATLDRLTGGFGGDELVVWAAEAGLGKSFLLNMLAVYVAIRYGHVAFFATEMGRKKTMQRLISLFSGITPKRQRQAFDLQNPRPFTPREQYRLKWAHEMLEALPITIFDGALSIDDIVLECGRADRRSPIKSVIVDTLGAVAELQGIGTSSRETQNDRQRRVVWLLKNAIAKRYDVPMHVAHHFSRAGSGLKPGERPRKEHLRDGGGIENTATTIIFPCAEEVGGFVNYLWVIAKARDGKKGELPMAFDGDRSVWLEPDMEHPWTPPPMEMALIP